MKKRFKKNICELVRYQTSQGRDLDAGLRLDRNERVTNFSPEVLTSIWTTVSPYALNVSPESDRLYAKLSSFLNISKEQLYITNGVTEAISFLFHTLSEKGDNIIVLDPTYPMYSVYANLHALDYRKFSYGNDLRPDWTTLEKSIDNKTAFVILPNPNLPVESFFTCEELRRIANTCQKFGSFLIVDEAYHHFGAPTALELIKEFDNVVVMRSFSKAFGLPSIRLGFMISRSENISYISKTRSLVESNTLSMSVAEYLLEHLELMQENVQQVKEGGAFLRSKLHELNVQFHGGQVTNGILIFLKNSTDASAAVSFLREKKIYVRGAFSLPFDRCIRVTIGAKEIMEKFIDAFEEWLVQSGYFESENAK